VARVKGSGQLGPTRSVRLPAAIDAWLESRITLHPNRSISDILLEVIHGGLRLRDGYMTVHRRVLERYADADPEAVEAYRACLLDTFGAQYLEHLDRWLDADGVTAGTRART